MSQELSREQLSALLDEELTEFEVRQLLRRTTMTGFTGQEYREFARWQLVKDVLKGQPVAAVPAEFSAQLAQAISNEAREQKPQWWAGLAKVVVAASVAAATVTVGWEFWQAESGGMSAPVVASSEPARESSISQAVRRGASAELVGLKPKAGESALSLPIEFLAPLRQPSEQMLNNESEQKAYSIELTPIQGEGRE